MNSTRNAALALVLCSACSSSTVKQVGSQFAKSGQIGPNGGTLTVSASDDATIANTSITIPPGALSASTMIQIGHVTNQPVVASGALGPVIDFEPSLTTFAKPATISIPVTLQGLAPSRVGVMAVEGDQSSHDITAVTVANGLATFQVSSFTHYGAHDEGGGTDTDGGCAPSCGGDAACGSSDGCGGTCNANCTDGGCTPSCAEGACGGSDGCGGTCACPGDGGCTPSCAEGACGGSDGCGGTCACVDGGSGCTEYFQCSDGGCDYYLVCDGGCPSPYAQCGSDCVDTYSDVNNCGFCGNACVSPAQDCVDGTCSCADSETLCGDPDAGVPLFCMDTTDNAVNCGACGNVCADTYATNSGCRFGTCECSPGQDHICPDTDSDGGILNTCSCIALATACPACTPNCDATSACLSSDGCCGTCGDNCGRSVDGGVCIPNCAGAACGANDNCGGNCSAACDQDAGPYPGYPCVGNNDCASNYSCEDWCTTAGGVTTCNLFCIFI